MHSCELITKLHAKKVLCHRVEVVSISSAATTDCVFCNVIGCRQISRGKAINLIKPEESAEGHQTLFPRERAGSGHETNTHPETSGTFHSHLQCVCVKGFK